MTHYSIECKRAAVAVFKAVKELRDQHDAKWLSPLHLASVAAGGASRSRIYEWLGSDLSEDEDAVPVKKRGRSTTLCDDEEKLLVGFAISTRSALKPVSLQLLQEFCEAYFNVSPSHSTLSRIMNEHGMTSQKARSRNSRMVSEEVVEDALDALAEIRSYNFPPNRIISMDETGLWSNIPSRQTYHWRNWSAFMILLKFWIPAASPVLAHFLQLFSLLDRL